MTQPAGPAGFRVVAHKQEIIFDVRTAPTVATNDKRPRYIRPQRLTVWLDNGKVRQVMVHGRREFKTGRVSVDQYHGVSWSSRAQAADSMPDWVQALISGRGWTWLR